MNLSTQLNRLTKPALSNLRTYLQLPKASRLNKTQLVQALSDFIMGKLSQQLGLLDLQTFHVLKQIVESDGVIEITLPASGAIEHLRLTGLIFPESETEESIVFVMPPEVKATCATELNQENLLAQAEANSRALCIARGLLEYYGSIGLAEAWDFMQSVDNSPDTLEHYTTLINSLGVLDGHLQIMGNRLLHCRLDANSPLIANLFGNKSRAYSLEQILAAGREPRALWTRYHHRLVAFLCSKAMPREDAANLVSWCNYSLLNGVPLISLLRQLMSLFRFASTDDYNYANDCLQSISNYAVNWFFDGAPLAEAEEEIPAPSLAFGKGKPKRNEPCPCNSGKKYKHCCLA